MTNRIPGLPDAMEIVNQELKSPRYYLKAAYALAAKFSDDPRTQNGAVLVFQNSQRIVGVGANQFPKGVVISPDRLARPAKYQFMEHAERNAIFSAIRNGERLEGATLYCPWFACCDCARAIIQAGIRRVVGHKQVFDKYGEGPWTESINVGNAMFAEAKVVTELYDGPIGGVTILFNGEEWNP